MREADGMAVIDCSGDKDALKVGVLLDESVGLDVGETDRIAVTDSRGEDDTLKAGVALEDSLVLADEDSTDSGEGVPVWQGVLAGEGDSEFVTDDKDVCEGVPV